MNTKQQARSLHKYLLRTRGGNEGCGQGLEPGPGAWGEGQFRPTKLSRGGRGWRRAPELGRRKGGALSLPRGPCGHLPASATVCPGPPRAKTFARTSPQLPPYLVALGKETLSIGDLGGDVKPRAQGHPTGERAADSGTHRLQGPPAPSSPRAEAGSKASASARPGRGRRSGGPRAEREVQSLRRPPGPPRFTPDGLGLPHSRQALQGKLRPRPRRAEAANKPNGANKIPGLGQGAVTYSPFRDRSPVAARRARRATLSLHFGLRRRHFGRRFDPCRHFLRVWALCEVPSCAALRLRAHVTRRDQ